LQNDRYPYCGCQSYGAISIDRNVQPGKQNLKAIFTPVLQIYGGEELLGAQVIRFCRCKSGAAAVEFALLVPVFLTLVFGIVIFGAYLAMIHGVQQLAAEAARSSIAGLTDSERGSLATSYVAANVSTYPLILPNNITVTAATSVSDPNVFVVTVSYNAAGMFIYSLPFVPAPPSTIVRSAAIPYGGF
jgi:Flp pilus assembly protein TadG